MTTNPQDGNYELGVPQPGGAEEDVRARATRLLRTVQVRFDLSGVPTEDLPDTLVSGVHGVPYDVMSQQYDGGVRRDDQLEVVSEGSINRVVRDPRTGQESAYISPQAEAKTSKAWRLVKGVGGAALATVTGVEVYRRTGFQPQNGLNRLSKDNLRATAQMTVGFGALYSAYADTTILEGIKAIYRRRS